jgi:hypothetical protein
MVILMKTDSKNANAASTWPQANSIWLTPKLVCAKGGKVRKQSPSQDCPDKSLTPMSKRTLLPGQAGRCPYALLGCACDFCAEIPKVLYMSAARGRPSKQRKLMPSLVFNQACANRLHAMSARCSPRVKDPMRASAAASFGTQVQRKACSRHGILS